MKPQNNHRRIGFLIAIGGILTAITLLVTKLSQSKHATTLELGGGENPAMQEAPKTALPRLTSGRKASSFVMHQHIKDAPHWAVAYGEEFWRRPAPEVRPVDNRKREPGMGRFNLGDVVERVSSAITRDDPSALPQMNSKTFAATFDGEGFRLSPNRRALREDGTPYLEPDPSTEITFRTISIQNGNWPRRIDPCLWARTSPSV